MPSALIVALPPPVVAVVPATTEIVLPSGSESLARGRAPVRVVLGPVGVTPRTARVLPMAPEKLSPTTTGASLPLVTVIVKSLSKERAGLPLSVTRTHTL